MIDPVAVTLGPLEIRWYALCIMTGLILAVFLATKEAPRKKILSESIIDFILFAFPLAILGARIYYVVFSWDLYKDNLLSVFAIWEGGLAIYGGLLMGFFVLVLFTRHHFIETWDFLDVAAPSVMIAQAIGRWGNFFNQEAYGASVAHLDYLPAFIRKQMYIDGSYRIPTFLYESLWNLLGFVLICVLRRRQRLLKQGEITLFYLIWYGAGRFVIEGMRTDSLMLSGLRISQWLSASLIFLALVLGIYRRRKDLPYY